MNTYNFAVNRPDYNTLLWFCGSRCDSNPNPNQVVFMRYWLAFLNHFCNFHHKKSKKIARYLSEDSKKNTWPGSRERHADSPTPSLRQMWPKDAKCSETYAKRKKKLPGVWRANLQWIVRFRGTKPSNKFFRILLRFVRKKIGYISLKKIVEKNVLTFFYRKIVFQWNFVHLIIIFWNVFKIVFIKIGPNSKCCRKTCKS